MYWSDYPPQKRERAIPLLSALEGLAEVDKSGALSFFSGVSDLRVVQARSELGASSQQREDSQVL